MYNSKYIIFFLLLIRGTVNSTKHDHTTGCTALYSDNNRWNFEFICETNGTRSDYFSNSNSVYCKKHDGNSDNYSKSRPTEITFRNCELDHMPDIFKWYNYVSDLNISGIDLQMIRSTNFENAKNLVNLTASNNQISELLSSIFSNAKKLKRIDFAHNKIVRIDPFAFDDATNLTNINLSFNNISTFDNRTFSSLIHLEQLDLADNLIEMIDGELFENLEQLKVLNISNNRLKRLECGVFANLTNLEHLKLTGNQFEEFNTSCVRSRKPFAIFLERNRLKNLTLSQNVSEVHVAGNQIKWIFIQGNLTNATVIDVSNNQIENIAELIKSLNSALRSLDLSDNAVGKLNVSTFAKFINLEHLALRNTNLSNIQHGTFHYQRNLRTLDISNNNLKKINFDAFWRNFGNLLSLHLNGNNLTEVNGLNRLNFPKMTEFSISRNNLTCDYLVGFLRQWESVQIRMVTMIDKLTDGTHVDGIECHQKQETKTEISPKKDKNSDTPTADNIDDSNQTIMKLMTFICAILCVVATVYILKTIATMWMAKKRLELTAVTEKNVAYLQGNRKNADLQSTSTMNAMLINVSA